MWNGEGFPPVGTVCEFNYFGEWRQGEVMFSCNNGCLIAGIDLNVAINNLSQIRPIKTEQNGEGFPPVGTECEVNIAGVWMKGVVSRKIRGVDRKRKLFISTISGAEFETSLDKIRPIKTEWDGEGFPPAGTSIEVNVGGAWFKGFAVGFDQHGSMVFNTELSPEFYCSQSSADFRPLRTERQMTQGDMLEIARANPTASMIELFGLFHDAGYRK